MDSTNLVRAGLNASYADYGQQCNPHDASICEITYPRANHDMWCCMSWCWVDESCPTSRASTVWPGHFWSSEKCTMNADVVSGCKYNLEACACRGTLPAGSLPGSFAQDYGSSCDAWDSTSCKATWYHNPDGAWNTSADHEWCCDSWCYVNEACPIAKQSWLGTGYYFSYETCRLTRGRCCAHSLNGWCISVEGSLDGRNFSVLGSLESLLWETNTPAL